VAEGQLRDRVSLAVAPAGATIAGATTARIESFPFLGRLLTSGSVSRIKMSAAEVTVEGLTFARVGLDLRDVTFDRERLLSDRKVVLSSLDRGTATAEVTQEQLSERLGVTVTLSAGKAQVRVAGQPALRIPKLSLVPCVADAEILPGRVRLTCSVDRIPAELVGRPLDEIKL